MKNRLLKYFSYENLCFSFSITVYVLFTIYIISLRVPFFDEINSWNIAQNCTIHELFQVSRHEGHFLLWYLLIKPFAVNNIAFPVSMYAVNWIIAFSAVLVLWSKAPFDPLIKTFITFSLPVQMFSVYARCYSIGMLILFVLCSLYKERFKHTLIYSFLIIFLANTSVIGTLIAFVFGMLYSIDALIGKCKGQVENKTIIQIFFIFIFGGLLVLSQLACYVVPAYSNDALRLIRFNEFFILLFNSFRDLALILMFSFMVFGLFLKKNIYAYLFLLLSNILILIFGYSIFTLAPWHYMFLYINVIVTMWIFCSENEIKTILQKIFYLIFAILCFSLVFYWEYNWYWDGFHIPTVEYIENTISEYENSNIFLFPTDSSIVGIVPSMRNYNIDFYDTKGYSYKSYLLYLHQWDKDRIIFNELEKILKISEKNSYLFIQCVEKFKPNNDEFKDYLSTHITNIKFIKYKELPDVIIYKMIMNKQG